MGEEREETRLILFILVIDLTDDAEPQPKRSRSSNDIEELNSGKCAGFHDIFFFPLPFFLVPHIIEEKI